MILGYEIKVRNLLTEKWLVLICAIIYVFALRFTEGVLGVNITGNGASLNLEVTEKDLLSKVKQILLLSDSYEK